MCKRRTLTSVCNRPESSHELSPVGSKHFQNKARHECWSIHIEAQQRSGVSQAEYCRQHRFDEKTFTRWLKHLAAEEAARKLEEYQTELRREKRREEREKGLKRRQRRCFSVSTDVRNRGTQAFWAMHVEAMNWSGMAFANTLQLCVCRPMRCANGATGWTSARLKSTGARILISPPARSLALVPGN